MNTFAVSFTIKYDYDYDERYESFMEAIRACPTVWTETTSFCLVSTPESLSDFQRRLYLTKFSPTRDKFLVMSVRPVMAAARGEISYPATLKSLLPNVSLLTQ